MTPWRMYSWLRDWAAIGGVRRPWYVTAWYAVTCAWLLWRWATQSAADARKD